MAKGTPKGAPLRWLREHVLSVPLSDACITKWPYHRNHKGYPVVKWQGKVVPVHHVILELTGRPKPPVPRNNARHLCGNGQRGCLHPMHLVWGTNRENVSDRLLHGTEPRGEKKRNAKLTEDDVRAIRASADNNSALSRRYGVDHHHIRRIRSGEKWSHVA